MSIPRHLPRGALVPWPRGGIEGLAGLAVVPGFQVLPGALGGIPGACRGPGLAPRRGC